LDLECYADAQRDEIMADDNWACPTCSQWHLTPSPTKEQEL